MAQREVYGFVVKGTTKEVNEMFDLVNYERFYNPLFKKYFDIWTGRYGTMFFIRKKYFVSYNGNSDYEDALWRYRKGV